MQRTRLTGIAVALVVALGVGNAAAAHEGGGEGPIGVLTDGARYFALLTSGQVVTDPPATSNASGIAFLTFSTSESELCYTLTFSGLEGVQPTAPGGAHIHGPAAPGANNHNHVAELDSGSPLNGCVVLTKEQAKWLRAGDLYFQIHTDLFPSGELRGQITRVK
jgi:hypothetical protein